MTEVDHKQELDDLIAENDVGARDPSGAALYLFLTVAVIWPVFQLYMASPLPFLTGIGLIDDSQQRAIHLAFALFLGFLAFPAFSSSSRKYVPIYDWFLAILGAGSCLYILFFYRDIVENTGSIRNLTEIIVSLFGILFVLEITRRALGISLVIVAFVFSAYVFAGPHLPDLISHRGFSLSRYVEHMWLTTEGVFGLPLGVSNSFIFLFVLFGALLDKAGAGNYFIKLSFAMLGHLRGGPGKAAVVASGLTGLISGSAIANVVTTGTFTIPLMKRIGFSGEKAAAIEVSSSINGQIMPPVMGAAAFLMTEFVGISYQEVVIHAFVPAVISYIGLYYIVHLEAVKANMPLLTKVTNTTFYGKIGTFLIGFGSVAVIGALVYFIGIGLQALLGGLATAAAAVLIVLLYLYLMRLAASKPELEIDDPNDPLITIPELRPTLLAGLHYILPIAVLVWSLMIERLSPGLSVSWAILVMVIIMLTQHPLMAFFKGRTHTNSDLLIGVHDLFEGFVSGSRNMIGIAVAMAAAGIIVGVVSLTGLGLLMTEIINAVADGNVMIMLGFTAIMCVVLGMGLPTTANYIVVASVMAQPLVTLAAQSGLEIPLFAVHLFVFYFGLISGVTPPVAVDAFAGAAVARSNPMATCIQAFKYSLRTAVLPFIFVFNPQILLLELDSWWQGVLIVVSASIAMLVFAAGTQGYFLAKSRLWESAVLIILALSLMRPGFWLDQVAPPYVIDDPANIERVAGNSADNAKIRLVAKGENFSGDIVQRIVVLPLGAKEGDGALRLSKNAGLEIRIEDGKTLVDEIQMGSAAKRWGLDFDWEILELQYPSDRLAKEWFYAPAYLLLLLLALLQLRRKRKLG